MEELHEFILESGLIVNEEFFDYFAMKASAKNWLYLAKYRFGTGGFYGAHRGVQLHDLQFSYSIRNEGMMYEGIAPKECITLGILQKSEGTVLVNDLKIMTGDMIIIDDTKPYTMSTSQSSTFEIVSISKARVSKEYPWLLDFTDKVFTDPDQLLSNIIDKKWKEALSVTDLTKNHALIENMEKEIVSVIGTALIDQTGETSQLTKGERTALEVKTFLLENIEEDTRIQEIVEQFGVSDKTLETSFKSLFGFTPKHFIAILKLNKAHEELSNEHTDDFNVSDIAIKWGFTHFGRFSKNYKALFGNFPSETLNQTFVH